MIRAEKSKQTRVLMTCGFFEPGFRGGGPVRSIAQVVDTIPSEIDLRLITSDRDVGDTRPYPGLSGQWIARGNTEVFYLNKRSPRQWLKVIRDLRALRSFDLLYVNSLWAPVMTVLPLIGALLNVIRVSRVMVAPRGELSRGALTVKARKKDVFLKPWRQVLRRLDVVWHATAEHEAADIRKVFPSAQIHVVPNQTNLPETALEAPGVSPEVARLVYISRIAPNKNTHLILECLQDIKDPVCFDIYGPIHDRRYWDDCKRVMGDLPKTVRVTYCGELKPADVRATFAQYDAFIFPTSGENFGHAIAESLSAACPVISTDKTPWTSVLEGGGGRVVRGNSKADLAAELERTAASPPADRRRQRQAAGDAYNEWRRTCRNTNVLTAVLPEAVVG